MLHRVCATAHKTCAGGNSVLHREAQLALRAAPRERRRPPQRGRRAPKALQMNSCREPADRRSIAPSTPSENVAMNDYVLNKKPEPVEMVWAFDLGHPLRLECCPSLAGAGEGGRRPGEGRWGKPLFCGEDRGEVSNPGHQKTEVNTIPQFLHKASRLIPAEFAETARQN